MDTDTAETSRPAGSAAVPVGSGAAGRPRVLFINAVPLNGGDEATLRATIEALQRRLPGMSVTVLCNDAPLTRTWIRDLELGTDLELAAFPLAGRGVPPLLRRVGNRLRSVALALLGARATRLPGARRSLDLYGRADIVLSSPGGYFHDAYEVGPRLRSVEAALDLGKPVVLLAQSVGPFRRPGTAALAGRVLGRVARICVRDEVSEAHLRAIGVRPDAVVPTADAAFLWRDLAPELYTAKSGTSRRIGVCFRQWPLGDPEALGRTVGRAVRFCEWLLGDRARELVFVSTCQGVPGYIDDSEVALDIVSRLAPGLRERCVVDRVRRAPRDLIAELARCDAFVGMRLHACILSMLGGTPAMGLGYEDKTPQVFGQLGLGVYQTPAGGDVDEWLSCAERFFADQDAIRAALPEVLDRAAGRAGRGIDAVLEVLGTGSGADGERAPGSVSPSA